MPQGPRGLPDDERKKLVASAASKIRPEMRAAVSAEDAVADAILSAFVQVKDWRRVDLRLVRHHLPRVLVDLARKERASAAAATAATAAARSIVTGVDEALRRKELLQLLKHRGVLQQDRLAIRLLERGFSEREAAAALRISYTGLRQRLHRLRERLPVTPRAQTPPAREQTSRRTDRSRI